MAPPLAAMWLERLFLKPILRNPPEREARWLASATRTDVRFDAHRRIPVYAWGEGPTVLLVHGWAGRGGQLGAFAEPLVRRGFRVVTYDAPAHGDSDGDLTGLPEFARAIERIAERFGPLHTVVAHSLGTAATTAAVARGLPVSRLVYVAPPSNPGEYLFQAADFLGFTATVAQRAQSRIERRFGEEFEDFRVARLARTLNVPLLILHDEDDKQVPFEEGQQIGTLWADAAFVPSRGLGHNRILRDDDTVARIVDFIANEPVRRSA